MKKTLIVLSLVALAARSFAAGQLVGITSNSLVVINPTNLAQVSVIGTFSLPPHIAIGERLTYHPVSARFFAYGIAAGSNRVTNQYLISLDPATANATVVTNFNSSWPITGGIDSSMQGYEGLEYVDSIGDMVTTRFSGSFVSSAHLRMREDGTTVFLVSNGVDNDNSVYDPIRDIYYNADGNDGARIERVNLSTGARQVIGSFNYGDMAFSTDDDAIYALGNPDNALRRIQTTNGGAPITTTLLGTIPGPKVLALAYLRDPGTQLSIRVSQVELCWNTAVGRGYQLQYRSDLTTNMWADIGALVTGDGTTNCVTNAVPIGEPRRFYRVVRMP